jgi:hypothetical protein
MNELRKLRLALSFFILALILSGLTVFPLQHELESLTSAFSLEQAASSDVHSGFVFWILTVRDGLGDTYAKYPWIGYGTDWLAFAHIVIAIFFIGPFINPIRNVWVLQAGLIACVLVLPLALICGEVRQIPFGWRLIDCSLGILGAIPLYYCLRLVKTLEGKDANC